MDHQSVMERFGETDLYVVITESFCNGRSPLDVLDRVLEAGVKLVQLREKELDDARLYERASLFREKTSAANALLILDDRLDIALAVRADGVHLGLSDLPIRAARSLAPNLIIGASSHDRDQALAAQAAGASYVNIGPIFATQTKSVSAGPIGPVAIEKVAPDLHVPFTCMGGIKLHNIEQVLERGAKHPAVVTAVTTADDVRQAALDLRNAIRERAHV